MDRKKKRTVWVFAIASFLNDFGAYMIFPIWPLFLTSVLGANMAILGLVDGLGDALVSLSQAGSGYLSDRLKKRKVFIWAGYFCGALSRVGYAFSTSWPMIIPFRVLDRAGKMRDAPRNAIVADASDHKNRGKNFGFLKGMDKFGAVVGIIACIIFFQFVGYHALFLFAAPASLIAGILVIVAIKERKQLKVKLHKGLAFSNLTKEFRLFLILSSIFALGSFSYSFLIIGANKAGFQPLFIPVLFLIFTIFAAAFAIPFGKLADKIGRKNVIFLAFTFWILTCLIFIFTQDLAWLVVAFVLYGLHLAALDPVQTTFVSELAPKKFRASAIGGFEMAIGLCALPASLGAGLLWDAFGVGVPFALSLGLTVIAMIMLLFVKEKDSDKK